MNALSKNARAAGLATEQDPRWAAVVARDRSADGTFYCCVITTGVYCRPSCAGRPLAKNVRFHLTRADAEQAGFRPCKRCKPDRFGDTNAETSTI
jgi:AraC family transcriptional regulator, regulatory protein of adaptative response / methylated-DNA-[protein]-cysteine methyltransferase